MVKLFLITLFLVTAQVFGDIPPSGPNVCRFTYSKVVRERLVASCGGFWTKSYCSDYRSKTAVGAEYRCCEGWHSTDNVTCTQDDLISLQNSYMKDAVKNIYPSSLELKETTDSPEDGLLESTAFPENTDSWMKSTSVAGERNGLFESTKVPEKRDGLFGRTTVPAKTSYYAIVATKNFRMTAVPQFSVKAHTAMGCARKCHNHPNQCRMFNMNKRTRWCRGFSTQPPTGAPAEHWELWRLVPS